MSDWQYFKMAEARPETNRLFTEIEREELELTVARQVASLLSSFGCLTEAEIDLVCVPECEDPITYEIAQYDELTLTDNTELIFSQLPLDDCTWDTTPGVYSIEQSDVDEEPITSITAHDPRRGVIRPIYYSGAERRQVEIDKLQELHEVLMIVSGYLESTGEANNPPIDTMQFPRPKPNPEYEEIVSQIIKTYPGLERSSLN